MVSHSVCDVLLPARRAPAALADGRCLRHDRLPRASVVAGIQPACIREYVGVLFRIGLDFCDPRRVLLSGQTRLETGADLFRMGRTSVRGRAAVFYGLGGRRCRALETRLLAADPARSSGGVLCLEHSFFRHPDFSSESRDALVLQHALRHGITTVPGVLWRSAGGGCEWSAR